MARERLRRGVVIDFSPSHFFNFLISEPCQFITCLKNLNNQKEFQPQSSSFDNKVSAGNCRPVSVVKTLGISAAFRSQEYVVLFLLLYGKFQTEHDKLPSAHCPVSVITNLWSVLFCLYSYPFFLPEDFAGNPR